jgi:NhaP-type Na+/H+ or K+/H+ antiporter
MRAMNPRDEKTFLVVIGVLIGFCLCYLAFWLHDFLQIDSYKVIQLFAAMS